MVVYMLYLQLRKSGLSTACVLCGPGIISPLWKISFIDLQWNEEGHTYCTATLTDAVARCSWIGFQEWLTQCMLQKWFMSSAWRSTAIVYTVFLLTSIIDYTWFEYICLKECNETQWLRSGLYLIRVVRIQISWCCVLSLCLKCGVFQ